jgi:hypothetical protein
MSWWEILLIILIIVLTVLGGWLADLFLITIAGILGLAYLGYQFVLYLAGIATAGVCRLVVNNVLPDECRGTCPPGQTCVATTTRPYGPWGWLGTQAATCGCTPVAAGGGTGGGTGGTTGGTGTSGSSGGTTTPHNDH